MTTITLEPFKEYIAEACGLRFDSGTGEEKLDMALAGRMQESGCTDQVDYLGQLKKDRDEFQRLVNLLTINETYFFREPEQLRLLSQRLIPRLLIRNDGSLPVKILSAGCSSGEEPYSLVISLLERYGESLSRFCSITGVDIDSTVLAKARAGQYGEFSFRGVPEDIRRRYFEKAARGWQLKQESRSRVTFKELNLLARAMPAGLKDFDLIFFRNVSIYFDEQTRLQIQQNLSSLMKEDGILIVGCSETIANDLGVFRMVEEEGLFYFIKGNPPMPEQSSLSVAFAAQKAKPAPPATDAPLPVLTLPDRWKLTTDSPQGRPAAQPSDLAGLHRLVAENQYDEALRNLDLLLAKEPENPDALLLKGSVLLNRKQFEAVRAIARQVRQNGMKGRMRRSTTSNRRFMPATPAGLPTTTWRTATIATARPGLPGVSTVPCCSSSPAALRKPASRWHLWGFRRRKSDLCQSSSLKKWTAG